MTRIIEASGLSLWLCDNEDQMQSGGIVNPRIKVQSYSCRHAFTRGDDFDKWVRKEYEKNAAKKKNAAS